MVDVEVVKSLFKRYYSNNPFTELDVFELKRREIAYQDFSGKFVRHLKVESVRELNKLAKEVVPAGLYHSTALYERPEVDDMELKGWLGAEVVFDIDADHLPDEICRAEVMTIKCLQRAAEEALKVVEIVEEELGISEYEVYFSGHRGFHVHILDKSWLDLDKDARLELLNYMYVKGFKLKNFVEYLRAGMEQGNVGRIKRTLSTLRIRRIDYDILKLVEGKVVELMKVHIDEKVLTDIARLIRTPNSLHGETGLKKVRLEEEDLHDVYKTIEKAIVFRELFEIEVDENTPEEVYGFELPKSRRKVEVPLHVLLPLTRLKQVG